MRRRQSGEVRKLVTRVGEEVASFTFLVHSPRIFTLILPLNYPP